MGEKMGYSSPRQEFNIVNDLWKRRYVAMASREAVLDEGDIAVKELVRWVV